MTFYSLHWVLRPASVKVVEVVKPNGGRQIMWISARYIIHVVAKTSLIFLLLDLETSRGRYLVDMGRRLRSLN